MFICGVICVLLAAGSFDYYSVELGVKEPECVGTLLIAGCFLLLPEAIFALWHERKKGGKR